MALKEKILEVMGGPHVAAIATVSGGLPQVRFMVLNGFDDMTLVGGTKKNSHAAIAIWSGKEFSDPYVEIQGTGAVHEDLQTKKKYWNPMFAEYFKAVDNPDYVVLVFKAEEIVYYSPKMTGQEVWKR
jgi:general stress protein 26